MHEACGRISGTFTLSDWNADVSRPDAPLHHLRRRRNRSTGALSPWRTKPADRLTVSAGRRLSWYDGAATALATGASADGNGEFTPCLGLTHDLDDTSSVHASYTEVFQPRTAQKAARLLQGAQGRSSGAYNASVSP